MSTKIVVNGMTVETNKEIVRITDSRVDFADGSFCDVASGTVVSKGRGYISLIGSGSEGVHQDMYYFNPVTFNERELCINDIPCNVMISGSDEQGTMLSFYGPRSIAEKIRWLTDRNRLTIDTNEHYSFPLYDTSKVDDLSMTHAGELTETPVLMVQIQKGATVSLGASSYPIRVLEVNGNMDVWVRGSAEVTIDSLKSAVLELTGSGHITIGNANGNIDAKLTGSGMIEVNEGAVQVLTIKLTGSGHFVCKPQVAAARLKLVGSGMIDAERIRNVVSKQSTGSGIINTGR